MTANLYSGFSPYRSAVVPTVLTSSLCPDTVPLVLTLLPCSDTVPLLLILSLHFCHRPHHLFSLSDIVPSFRYRPVCSVIVVMVLSSLPLFCHRSSALSASSLLCHCPLCSVIVPSVLSTSLCSVIVPHAMSSFPLCCLCRACSVIVHLSVHRLSVLTSSLSSVTVNLLPQGIRSTARLSHYRGLVIQSSFVTFSFPILLRGTVNFGLHFV